jgi:hypothetical protein
MNERIKELVKQAGGHFSTHNLMSNPVQHRESIELWDNNIEKFAESIIKECINKIETHEIPVGNSAAGEIACEMTYSALKHIRDEIKEHFGVRE